MDFTFHPFFAWPLVVVLGVLIFMSGTRTIVMSIVCSIYEARHNNKSATKDWKEKVVSLLYFWMSALGYTGWVIYFLVTHMNQ